MSTSVFLISQINLVSVTSGSNAFFIQLNTKDYQDDPIKEDAMGRACT
jgi:hypothetical protein